MIKSDHKAVIAYADKNCMQPTKVKVKRTYRRINPTQHAIFLQHVAKIDLISDIAISDTQTKFDKFYDTMLQLLHKFYPERTVTVSSRDPDFITPVI